MTTFNRVILAGNLTRDPEIRYLPTGLTVATFSIAVNDPRVKSGGESKEEVYFFDITAFGKLGEVSAEYLKKGRPILVEGKLRQSRWEKDGQKRSKIEVVADNIQFLGSRGGEGRGGDDPGPSASPGAGPSDEDVPF